MAQSTQPSCLGGSVDPVELPRWLSRPSRAASVAQSTQLSCLGGSVDPAELPRWLSRPSRAASVAQLVEHQTRTLEAWGHIPSEAVRYFFTIRIALLLSASCIYRHTYMYIYTSIKNFFPVLIIPANRE